jgi:hypothetical protein
MKLARTFAPTTASLRSRARRAAEPGMEAGTRHTQRCANPLPDHLSCEDMIFDVESGVGLCCGHAIGESVSEMLDLWQHASACCALVLYSNELGPAHAFHLASL